MTTPKVNSDGQKELRKLEDKFDDFVNTTKEFDPFKGLQNVPVSEPQTKLSRREAEMSDAQYIRPVRSVARSNFKTDKVDSRVYFSDAHKQQYERDWEYVKCIVENNELIGQMIEAWTAKWGCDPAHFWHIPVNKPIRIPRHLAEQISKCCYHRLKMEDNAESKNYVDAGLIVDSTIRRLDARPVGFGF